VLLLVGVAALWGGTQTVMSRVPRLAAAVRVSPLTVTVLLLAVLSSMPEFCVSLFSSLRGQDSAALGNIVGSNLVTLTFVTGVCALWRPIDIGPTLRDRESSWMVLSAALLLVLALDGRVSRTDGAVLVLAYLPYVRATIRDAQESRRLTAAAPRRRAGPSALVLFLVGLALILGGAELVVRNGTALARSMGMSDLMIGITFFAFGTSLPELAIALGATVKGEADVTLGEVYASNIVTGTAVVGTIALVRPLHAEPSVTLLALPLLVLSGVILQVFITTGRRYVRTEALCMILLYVVFLCANFFNFRLDLP
jgi:cation:H+ antiporter